MRFLFAWHHLDANGRLSGIDGLRAVAALLDGFEAPAAAWERTILPARMDRYDPALLDMLCLTGEVGWARLSPAATSVGGATPIAIFLREHAAQWLALRDWAGMGGEDVPLSAAAARVLATSRRAARCSSGIWRRLRTWTTKRCMRPSASWSPRAVDRGRLRRPSRDRRSAQQGRIARRPWTGRAKRPLERDRPGRNRYGPAADAALETQARALLARYGVVFRRLAAREANAVPWRALARAYRRLEARGEIRGGRFVTGMSGEQFALPEAVERLREVRRTPKDGRLITISAADPLNLAGILDSGDRVRTITAHRIVYRDGIALAALEGDYMRPLRDHRA